MNIELSDAKTVRITWPAYDATTEAEIIRRLGTVPGAEGMGRRWYAPAIQVARLMELFPKASYGYAALKVSDGLARAFFASLVYLGIELQIDASGAICAVGEGVSPLIQQLVDERAHALRPLVLADQARPTPAKAQRPQPQPSGEPLTEEDRKWQSWLTGIHNAAAKVKYPKRRRRRRKQTPGDRAR